VAIEDAGDGGGELLDLTHQEVVLEHSRKGVSQGRGRQWLCGASPSCSPSHSRDSVGHGPAVYQLDDEALIALQRLAAGRVT
jgi:hypothetical protein